MTEEIYCQVGGGGSVAEGEVREEREKWICVGGERINNKIREF